MSAPLFLVNVLFDDGQSCERPGVSFMGIHHTLQAICEFMGMGDEHIARISIEPDHVSNWEVPNGSYPDDILVTFEPESVK